MGTEDQGPGQAPAAAAQGAVVGGGRHVVGVVVFALALIAGFAFMGNYLHDLSGVASYELEAGAGRGRRGEVSALIGRDLFNGAGACVACHMIGDEGSGIRGPNLGVRLPDFAEPIGVRAADAQSGQTAVEHVVEALYEPDAYVAPGFEGGVMMPVHEPPISLDHEQIRSLVLYLFQVSGALPDEELAAEIREAQRPWTGEEPAEAIPDAGPPPLGLPPGDPSAGEAEWARLRCGDCHDEGATTPLDDAVASREPGELHLVIASHAGGHGTLPEVEDPPDYANELTVRAVADLVAHLRAREPDAPDAGAAPVDAGTTSDGGVP